MLSPLPQPLVYLMYASMVCSTITLVFSILDLRDSPAFLAIPVAFLFTIPFHITTLIIARFEPHGSARLWSKLNIIWAFVTSSSWTASFGLTLAFTIRQGLWELSKQRQVDTAFWLMVVPTSTSLLECIVSWFIAWVSYRERKKITDEAKWRPIVNLERFQTWR